MASVPPEDGSILPTGWTWSDVGHGALDIVGLVPVLGEAADLTNAAWYAAEGNYLDAGLSAISTVPIVGDIIGKGGKIANKAGGKLAEPALRALRRLDIKKTLEPLKHNSTFKKVLGESANEAVDKMVEALEKWRKALTKHQTQRINGVQVCPKATKVLGEAGVMVGKTPVPKRIIEKMSDEEFAFFEKKIKEVEDLDLISRQNKSVFYSGKSGGKYSYEIAEERAIYGEFDSVNSLSGDILNRDGIRDILPDDAMRFVDNMASRKLAGNASGHVNFIGEVDTIGEKSVFRTIELPELLKNPKISPESRKELQAMKDLMDKKYGP